MKSIRESLLLYAVTDRSWLDGKSLATQVEEALLGGVTCLQLREKNLTKEEFLQEAISIQKLCKKYQVPFIINDDVELAIKIQADGVHVGQSDLPAKEVRKQIGDKMILGVSCQTVAQAKEAELSGADYLGVGAMFGTDTKTDASITSMETLTAICSSITIPVVAIGGIKETNIAMFKDTGIAGFAIVSDIFAAPVITTKVESLYQTIKLVVNHE